MNSFGEIIYTTNLSGYDIILDFITEINNTFTKTHIDYLKFIENHIPTLNFIGAIQDGNSSMEPIFYYSTSDILYEIDPNLQIVTESNIDGYNLIVRFVGYIKNELQYLSTLASTTIGQYKPIDIYSEINENLLITINGIHVNNVHIDSSNSLSEYLEKIEFHKRWIQTSRYWFFSKETIEVYTDMFPITDDLTKIINNPQYELNIFPEEKHTGLGRRMARFVENILIKYFAGIITTSTGIIQTSTGFETSTGIY